MYDFCYNDIKNKYGKNSRLLFTDTGSLMYKIKTENVYEDFSKEKIMLNFSSYSSNSKYYDDLNKEFPFKRYMKQVMLLLKNLLNAKI